MKPLHEIAKQESASIAQYGHCLEKDTRDGMGIFLYEIESEDATDIYPDFTVLPHYDLTIESTGGWYKVAIEDYDEKLITIKSYHNYFYALQGFRNECKEEKSLIQIIMDWFNLN